jgi:hypothetical protein
MAAFRSTTPGDTSAGPRTTGCPTPCLLRPRRGARRRRADHVGHSLPARDEAWGLYDQAHASRQTSPSWSCSTPRPLCHSPVPPGRRKRPHPARMREPELPAAWLAPWTTSASDGGASSDARLSFSMKEGLRSSAVGVGQSPRAVWWGAALISLLPPHGRTRRMGGRLWGARPKGAVRRPDEKRRLGGPPSWQPDASPS